MRDPLKALESERAAKRRGGPMCRRFGGSDFRDDFGGRFGRTVVVHARRGQRAAIRIDGEDCAGGAVEALSA